MDLTAFAAEVGGIDEGPVVAVGGRTQWDVGGGVAPATREVHAPAGIVSHVPAEMTVRVRAGTTVDELQAALAEHGQCVALPGRKGGGGGREGATVGGALAVGHSGIRRLGWGPVRDAVLEVRYVSADGRLVMGGGPTVKNVSGFDIPRLMVGSLGTLGLLAEVVLRTRPLPVAEQWFAVDDMDPFVLARQLYRPAAVLWNGTTTWLLLDGHPTDIEASARTTGLSGHESGPPSLDGLSKRWSLRPSELAGLEGEFLAEVGVGVVHRAVPQPPRPIDPAVADLHRRIKSNFDPTGRLAPGRDVLV